MQSCSYRSDYLIATFKIGFFSQLRCFNGKKKKTRATPISYVSLKGVYYENYKDMCEWLSLMYFVKSGCNFSRFHFNKKKILLLVLNTLLQNVMLLTKAISTHILLRRP